MKQTTVDDGVTIAYTVFDGVEPAVVLLHGLAGSSREFVRTAEGLAGRRVILIDQRGHGHSTTKPADTSREAYVFDVVTVISKETSGPVDSRRPVDGSSHGDARRRGAPGPHPAARPARREPGWWND
ncbi:alpha/beta fold hydrolase [Frigoribacterium sp. SL97]|nr:alpha/beta fold hydrolase [Frigoribacterium sp. SL97]